MARATRQRLLDAAVFERAESDPAFFRLLVQRHHEPDVAEAIEAALESMRTMTVGTILHPNARTKSLSQQAAAVAARRVIGIFLAGLEEVLAGARPLMVSRVCANFMTDPVFAMAGLDTPLPLEAEGPSSEAVSPTAD